MRAQRGRARQRRVRARRGPAQRRRGRAQRGRARRRRGRADEGGRDEDEDGRANEDGHDDDEGGCDDDEGGHAYVEGGHTDDEGGHANDKRDDDKRDDDERNDERDEDQSNSTHPGHESGEGARAAQSVVAETGGAPAEVSESGIVRPSAVGDRAGDRAAVAGGGGMRTPHCGRAGGWWELWLGTRIMQAGQSHGKSAIACHAGIRVHQKIHSNTVFCLEYAPFDASVPFISHFFSIFKGQ